MEFGIYTLADIGPNPYTGQTVSAKERIQDVLKAAKLADELGFQIFGVGEHHRLDYAVSSVPVVLSAIAQQTKNIKLTSTTTVLSTVDPVRLYEDFATLDLLSDGRAEIIAGRGAFVESFPLFGYNLEQYNELFEENLALWQKLNKEEIITWNGQLRAPLRNAQISPRATKEIPTWIGVGGTPESAMRAGRFGTGLALAVLGGDPKYFVPLVDAYKREFIAAGHPQEQYKVAVTAHGYIHEDGSKARDEYYAYYKNYWGYVNKQRGMAFHLDREGFERMTGPRTALFVGSPDEVVEKILMQHEVLGHTRFLAQVDIGGQPFETVARSMELLATKVMPKVNQYIK